MWTLVRPFAYSAIRTGTVSLAAILATRYGLHVDEGTVNGMSGLALNALDLGVAAAGGVTGSFFSNFGAIKSMLGR